ncbi:iron-containing alcohol dehydrogenase (plasmid) [Lichenicola cladoniae]|uniref:Alcohol dehydrogenase 2 n=1 Tax=Lichenicola cladoniae TaxID=1484109 RepID=A0A6M8I105_9PROT|nr:iron-containing alcohol dehydrogenase [Lichenicola cladoniae]NPD69308.1 iron-containing alcohol dehydrogenase [Acetobacteraceae bacterium]QKE93895.1 iron-containing alcohol dehydrogenase [Lichenicola cladoniae]
MQSFTFHTVQAIHVAPGLAAKLPAKLALSLGSRVLVVTDASIRRLGLLDPFIACLSAAGADFAVFDGVFADPPEDNIHAAVALAVDFPATGIVGFGGGSAMDVAKVVALIAGSGQTLDQVYGMHVATGPRLPLMLVPTTAGTGSEVTPIAIITADGVKKGVISQHLLPDIAILDAELTIGLPPAVTAMTGLDAMVHAIEAFASASPNRNPVSQGLARQALRLLGTNLRRVVADGTLIDARASMLLGSLLAGQAFANSPVAAVHALSYPIGGQFHIPHGLSNALVLPHVLRFNLPNATEDYAAIAADAFPDLATVPHAERGLALIEALVALIGDVGLPTTLEAVGIPEGSLESMADEAMQQTRLLVNNPRPVTREDALRIYRAAYS